MLAVLDEATLAKWEANPVRYRRQIKRYDNQIFEHHRNVIMRQPLPVGDHEEFDRIYNEHMDFYRLMARVTKMTTEIIRYDNCQLEIDLRRSKHHAPKMEVFITADAEDYEWLQWVKQYPITGTA